MPAMRPIVLVHGAWHGAWCWYRVVPELATLGLRAVTPALPGHVPDARPPGSVTLADYVATVVAALDAVGPATLVGHSLAGVVIAAVAEARPDLVTRLVYLAALVPGDGDSAASLVPPDPASPLARASQPTPDGAAIALDPAAVPALFYADCPAADVALAGQLLRPEPLAPLLAPVALTAGRAGRVPATYIECAADRVVPPPAQQRMALRCQRRARLGTGHSPFFAAPAALAALLAP